MCSAAGLACISLELLPDTSARAAHSHMSRRLQAGGLRERLASCSRSAAQTILLILEHLSFPDQVTFPVSHPGWHTPLWCPPLSPLSPALSLPSFLTKPILLDHTNPSVWGCSRVLLFLKAVERNGLVWRTENNRRKCNELKCSRKRVSSC